jgi:altronate dehydratase
MAEDMDFNAGRILEENIDLDTAAKHLLDKVIAAASGERTKSEWLGFGEMEFVPWFQEGFV